MVGAVAAVAADSWSPLDKGERARRQRQLFTISTRNVRRCVVAQPPPPALPPRITTPPAGCRLPATAYVRAEATTALLVPLPPLASCTLLRVHKISYPASS